MGFNSVYQTLQELFPQIDSRILKAVSIEHAKDADAAADVILSEVLPYMSKQSMVSSSSCKTIGSRPMASNSASGSQVSRGSSDGGAGHVEQSGLLRYRRGRHADSTRPDEAPNEYDANDQSSANNESKERISLGKAQEVNVKVGADKISSIMSNVLMHEDCANDDHDQACGDTESEELILLGNKEISDKVGPEQTPYRMSSTSIHEYDDFNISLNDLHFEWKDFDGPTAHDFDTVIHRNSNQLLTKKNSNQLVVEDSVAQLVQSAVQGRIPDVPEIGSSTSITDCEKSEASGSLDLNFKQDHSENETVDIEDGSTLNAMVNRSSQICRIDLLEGIIEDAKNNKKTLFSAMESVINTMREVELRENAAEQAKEEAVKGSLDILTMVEELKEMIVHAKEANDMHAGEVYGEKAVLETEARELQSRLFNLADERDKSLAILDEMRQTMEARLAAAEEVKKAAEQEKLEKGEYAWKALAEQEAIMEKVVQKSKMLQEEAEENSKLQEFLMDRGRVVDMLQGEISVICQDVRLLKEKFDERVPLSKSISSSQTSCILASSSSSLKSVASDLVTDQGEVSKSPKKTSLIPSVESPKSELESEASKTMTTRPTPLVEVLSPKNRLEEERARVDCKVLLDDWWDFFDDKDAELCS